MILNPKVFRIFGGVCCFEMSRRIFNTQEALEKILNSNDEYHENEVTAVSFIYNIITIININTHKS